MTRKEHAAPRSTEPARPRNGGSRERRARRETAQGRGNGRRAHSARIPPETRRGITVVVLSALAGLALLSLADLAGPVGEVIHATLRSILGWGKLLVPLLLAAFAVILFRERSAPVSISWNLAAGVASFFIAFLGILHLLLPPDAIEVAWGRDQGGGYVGFLVRIILEQPLGFLGALIVLVALFAIGLLLAFRASLVALLPSPRSVGRGVSDPMRAFLDAMRAWRTPLRSEQHGERATRPPLEFSSRPLPPSPPSSASSPPPPLLGDRSASHADTHAATGEQLALFPKPPQGELFPRSLLSRDTGKPGAGNVVVNAEKIKKLLATFGIEVEMKDVHIGPRVAQYTLALKEGIKVREITGLSQDLALALAAHPIRIEAPIPGKSLVGIEVPNIEQATVSLRDILGSPVWRKRDSPLAAVLGTDVAGNPHLIDLGAAPHLLIAGATGSGKSVAVNAILLSLLFENSPDDLQLLLLDPKRVELVLYNDIPHLITPVVADVKDMVQALRWTVKEMDRRFSLFAQNGSRNLASYNERHRQARLPAMVVAIDELADLMAVAAGEVEGLIVRLAQMARATGIHLILATQRPSVDVITGLIKANITSRIAFAVASQVDSRTILDTGGAEKLLGRGDMLYFSPQLSKPLRLQGAYVSDEDIHTVVKYLARTGKPVYEEGVLAPTQGPPTSGEDFSSGEDPLLADAKELVIRSGKASASLLQRRLKVGYARAARLLDLLEEQRIIGPGEGAKPREILVRLERRDSGDES